DFGLAKHLDESTGMTPSSAVLGTPSYMAPEQAIGKSKEIGPATDVYALGAILYECLTGRPPFAGESLLATLDLVRYQHPRPPRQLNHAIPAPLETICLRCLKKSPAHRYPSAQALAQDLENFLEGRPLKSSPLPLDSRDAGVSGYEVIEELQGSLWKVFKARSIETDEGVILNRLRSDHPLDSEHINAICA